MTAWTDGGPVKVGVTGCLALRGGEAAQVAADLVYRPRDCLAVNMVMRGPDAREVGWTFAWDLLRRGLTGPAGAGDIRVRPAPGVPDAVEVVFVSSFAARIRFPAAVIGAFVRQVEARAALDEPYVVPALEAELAAIMEAA